MDPRHPSYLILLLFLHVIVFFPSLTSCTCSNKCGSIDVRYPFGTGCGCGSPHFYPSVTCIPGGNDDDNSAGDSDHDDKEQLVLATHTGRYPITSISYSAATLTIAPPLMSTCSSMHPSAPNIGLDWSAPFQLASSVFVLLACPAPTSSLASHGNLICDAASGPRLCGALLECPSVASLGLPLFAPTNTCCVYSPVSLGPKGDLDLQGLGCAAYASVASLGPTPMDPSTWDYGVSLKYGEAEIEVDGLAEACAACERSDGVCGYEPPKNYFVCVCKSGVNSSTDCYGQKEDLTDFWRSTGNASITGHVMLVWKLMLLLGCWWLVL
ncbi:hypothetical protein MUK42_21406 [Musa troglodytarum]|uniref:Wall-associated receptor kinase C-terminal domain-containing protein n=1 Tax=Musa troglodytarum TaxID=320322 RepID=A0A9E7JZH8_9LILI|nr:hypothetical protein MUK42_21406 [Musa troglodytarum]